MVVILLMVSVGMLSGMGLEHGSSLILKSSKGSPIFFVIVAPHSFGFVVVGGLVFFCRVGMEKREKRNRNYEG